MDLLTVYAAIITFICAIIFLGLLKDDEGNEGNEGNEAFGLLIGWLVLGLPFFGRAFGWW